MKLATLFLLAISAFADHKGHRPESDVPEPSTYILIGLGLTGLIALRHKRK